MLDLLLRSPTWHSSASEMETHCTGEDEDRQLVGPGKSITQSLSTTLSETNRTKSQFRWKVWCRVTFMIGSEISHTGIALYGWTIVIGAKRLGKFFEEKQDSMNWSIHTAWSRDLSLLVITTQHLIRFWLQSIARPYCIDGLSAVRGSCWGQRVESMRLPSCGGEKPWPSALLPKSKLCVTHVRIASQTIKITAFLSRFGFEADNRAACKQGTGT